MRAIFFGTPAVALPSLEALTRIAEVAGVVCQPDRPAGRGLRLQPPPVKTRAIELGLPVYQPERVKTGELEAWLRERAPDVALVLAYGRILPPAVLGVPRSGCINLHASLLPKYRGAAPIQWAIVHGEAETGISLMQMDEGLDTGPVFGQRAIAIGAEETAGELSVRLAALAAELVLEELTPAVSGTRRAVPQDPSQATHAPLIEREQARIDFSARATAIANLVRGMAPRPGAHTTLRGSPLKISAVRPLQLSTFGVPGTIAIAVGRILVSAGEGALELRRAQLEGRKDLSAADLIHGRSLKDGDILGS